MAKKLSVRAYGVCSPTCRISCVGKEQKNCFHDISLSIAFVSGSSTTTEIVAGLNVWRNEDCVLIGERWQPSGDSKVSTMLDFVEGWLPERRDMLIDRFVVDMDWRVNQLSDGRKRRVQLLLAFARPASVLLLDEVTTDLDVLARQTLLDFLREVFLYSCFANLQMTTRREEERGKERISFVSLTASVKYPSLSASHRLPAWPAYLFPPHHTPLAASPPAHCALPPC